METSSLPAVTARIQSSAVENEHLIVQIRTPLIKRCSATLMPLAELARTRPRDIPESAIEV